MELSDLPNEILVKILALVSTGDLLQNVARVSKRYYEITQQPSLHVDVHLDLRVRFAPENFFLLLLRRSSLMRFSFHLWESARNLNQ